MVFASVLTARTGRWASAQFQLHNPCANSCLPSFSAAPQPSRLSEVVPEIVSVVLFWTDVTFAQSEVEGTSPVTLGNLATRITPTSRSDDERDPAVELGPAGR
jgi:hypothetical protein